MSEFEFFKGRADRWGDSMRALWGSLEICPPTDHIDLPHHTAGELLSIGHLKVWGDAQKLHLGMAYFLVWADDISEAGNYGLAIVWIDSCQARMVSMGEALEALSSHTPEGSDWPYILIQSYKGANHMPLPRWACLCPTPRRSRKPMWVDKPIKNLPAPICRAVSCFPHGVKPGQSISDHWFTRITTHGFLCHHWRISLHRG